MQFAGQFIVQCLPVAVMYCVCTVYTLLSNLCCLCVYVCVCVSGVFASLFYAAIAIFWMNKVDY